MGGRRQGRDGGGSRGGLSASGGRAGGLCCGRCEWMRGEGCRLAGGHVYRADLAGLVPMLMGWPGPPMHGPGLLCSVVSIPWTSGLARRVLVATLTEAPEAEWGPARPLKAFWWGVWL